MKGAAPRARIKDVAIAIRIIGETTPFSTRIARLNSDFVANLIEMK
jgi:hypothetical protein